MDTVLNIALITSNPQVRGGRPCLLGTGLRVSDVVIAYRDQQRSPDTIAADYGVSLAGVHAGLAYYYEHQDEIDRDIRQQLVTTQQLKEEWIASGGTPLLSR